MTQSSFVHLHTHTEYSLLDGAARIDKIVKAAAADGQPALGITDHGNMYGVLDFYKACNKQGITPVLGTEAYMALESRDERPRRKGSKVDDSGGISDKGQKLYYHLTLLAENNAGYQNLIKLSSAAFMEGYYYKPRMDWDMFATHSEGLIATSGCLGSVVQQALLANDYDTALKRAARLQDIFGRDSFYIEMQDHNIPEQHKCNPMLLDIAKSLKAPLLATNDLHYTKKEHQKAHDALLCVQTKSLMSDDNRFKFHGQEHYLKTAAEMRHVFQDIPSSCDNTLLVAERSNVEIEFGRDLLPTFEVPSEHKDADSYLSHLTYEGAHERWGSNLSEEIQERLQYELGVISHMGFSPYFLITWDLIRHANESGIRVGPGRGSAAGCAVAYCLRITDLDPIHYGLLFERFLNPARISMPDIDIDFDDRYRDRMIRYTAQKYGQDHVAQIITFSTIKAKAAIRDSARVLGKPYAVGDRIAKGVPGLIMGRDTPLKACLELDPDHAEGYKEAKPLRDMYETEPEVTEIIDLARGLENLIRQDSIHAAAVVISPGPLTEYLPIQRKPEANVPLEMIPVVTQYDMGGVESLGLLKMDFLGLRTLSIIDDALRLIEQAHGEKVDVAQLPLDDTKTYQLMADGDTRGVFQLEGANMRKLMRDLCPTCFEDVAALVALYRPGPMAADMHNSYARRKNGTEAATPPHKDLSELLQETYGLMIYQESMMRVAQEIAGYSMAEADDLRKACGKKNREQIAEHRSKFIDGAVAGGYTAALGKSIFDTIEPFADYAFNKSHAFAYGLIAYQTAYLKANYMPEFLAATLTGTKHNIAKTSIYLTDARRHEIRVVPPDINLSQEDFSTYQGQIPFGFAAVRHIGDQVARMIVAERNKNGPYASFSDFCERAPQEALNKRVIETLIKVGAFDCFKQSRNGLLSISTQSIAATTRKRKDEQEGIQSLFADASGTDSIVIDVPDSPTTTKEVSEWEYDLLGSYLSEHPLARVETELMQAISCEISDLNEYVPMRDEDGREMDVRIGGMLRDVRVIITKKGDRMAKCVLEDMESTTELVVFPRTYAMSAPDIQNNAIVLVRGRIDKDSEGDIQFLVSSIEPFNRTRHDGPDRLHEATAHIAAEPERATPSADPPMDEVDEQTDLEDQPTDEATQPIVVNIEQAVVDDHWLQQLDALIHSNPGPVAVYIATGQHRVDLQATVSEETRQDLVALGANAY